MTIQDIYNLAIKLGVKADFRGEKKVKSILDRLKEKYENLNADEKKEFDKEKFTNPYSDTRILAGEPNKQIKKAFVGIDIQPSELMLARELGCDLVISHHPLGAALADLSDVMQLHAQILAKFGIPINIAESLMEERISEVARGISAINHFRTVDAAKLLKINLMCVHTAADNLAAKFLDDLMNKKKPETLGDILKELKQIPEYAEATLRKTGPKIFVGNPEMSAGKIVLTEVTGGTQGAVGIYEKMSQYGIGTIIGMHTDEERRKEAIKHHVNIVIAGHISSDSLGMNLFLDELEKKGVDIISGSGLIRISRNRKANDKSSRKK